MVMKFVGLVICSLCALKVLALDDQTDTPKQIHLSYTGKLCYFSQNRPFPPPGKFSLELFSSTVTDMLSLEFVLKLLVYFVLCW